eukprot:409874_1
MNKSATALCSAKGECHCYKCCLINTITSNKITDEFPNDLLDSIVSYIGTYAIYGKINNKYQIISQLSNVMDRPNNIYIHHNHVFFYSQNNNLLHSYINNENSNPIPLHPNNNQSILCSISNPFLAFFGVKQINTHKNTNNRFIIAKRNKCQSDTFLIANQTSLELFEIEFLSLNNYKITPLPKLEKQLKSFQTSNSDIIKQVAHLYDKYWFLFENGKLIEIPSMTQNVIINQYPAYFRDQTAIQISNNARDIGLCSNRNYQLINLIIDKDNNLWTHQGYYGNYVSPIVCQPVRHPSKLFQNNNVKSIVCSDYNLCIILDNGLCYLFGLLVCRQIPISFTLNGILSSDESYTLFQQFDNLSTVKIVDAAIGQKHIILLDDKGCVYGIGKLSMQNRTKFCETPYLMKRHEIGILNARHKIVKVIAVENRHFFVTKID